MIILQFDGNTENCQDNQKLLLRVSDYYLVSLVALTLLISNFTNAIFDPQKNWSFFFFFNLLLISFYVVDWADCTPKSRWLIPPPIQHLYLYNTNVRVPWSAAIQKQGMAARSSSPVLPASCVVALNEK